MTGALDTIKLPERTRLFHIGPPKTATTALQAAAAQRRPELLAHGVRYPGTQGSHRHAIAAFVGRPVSWVASTAEQAPPPPRERWDALLAEIEQDTERRVLVGHEYAAGSDDETAKRFAEALGPSTHVVVTLRSYGAMLPSIWQEHNKAGNTETFHAWLERNLARPRSQRAIERFHVRHDQGMLVGRWAAAVGPENVTVVVVDPGRPRLVFEAFEAMLGLPDGFFGAAGSGVANRSLSVPEIELFRRLNTVLRPRGVDWKDYQRLVADGAALRMLRARGPADGEPRLRLPGWAADRADEEARRHVEEIAASGVRVVGDLGLLAAPAPRRDGDDEDHTTVGQVPLDAAVEALAGAVSAALRRGTDFGPPPPPPAPKPPAPKPARPDPATLPVQRRQVGDVTSAALVRVVVRRARKRLRTFVGRGRGRDRG